MLSKKNKKNFFFKIRDSPIHINEISAIVGLKALMDINWWRKMNNTQVIFRVKVEPPGGASGASGNLREDKKK